MFLALSSDQSGGYVDVVDEVVETPDTEPVAESTETEAVDAGSDILDVVDDTPNETQDTASSLDEGLVKTWKEMGYPEGMLSDFQSDDELRRSMAAQDAMALAPIRQKRGQVAEPPVTPGQPAPKLTDELPAATQAAKTFEKLKLNLEGWDEDAAAALNSLNDHYASALEKMEAELRQRDERYSTLEQTLTSQQQRQLQEQAAQEDRAIESWFGELGDDYAEMFGKGSLAQLTPEIAAVRIDVVNDAFELAQLDAKLGRPPQDLTSLLSRALHSRFPEKQSEITRKQIAESVQSRRKQAISRPSSRNGKPVTGRDKAIQRVNSFFKTRGSDVPADDDTADHLL